MLHEDDDDDFDGVYQDAYLEGYFFAQEEFRQGLPYNEEHINGEEYSLEYDAWCDGYGDFWFKELGLEYE